MGAVRMVYLPANAAWMVLWHESRLAGPMTRDEAQAYVRWLEVR